MKKIHTYVDEFRLLCVRVVSRREVETNGYGNFITRIHLKSEKGYGVYGR